LKNSNNGISNAALSVTKLGEAPAIGIAGIFYLGGIVCKDQQAKESGLLGAEALLHAGIFVTALKYIAGRERPTVDNNNGNFELVNAALHESNHNSFPSGHTTSAWALATVFATQYKDTQWVPAIAYGSAFAVGLSRIMLEKHWPGDVVAGSLLGYAIGKATVQVHRKNCHMNTVVVEPSMTGMRMSYTF
jgi:membrane-associated phospholipid phosphatase